MMSSMTLWRRVGLPVLTVTVLAVLVLAVVSSWQQPQPQNLLQLRVVDWQLQATAWPETPDWVTEATLSQAEQTYRRFQEQPVSGDGNLAPIRLRLGLIQVVQGKVEPARQTWQAVQDESSAPAELQQTAQVLSGLWEEPPRLLPEAERLLVNHLSGWYAQVALQRLYELQQRQAELTALAQETQQRAQEAITRLLVVVGMPLLAGIGGTLLLVGLGVQWLWRGRQSLLGRQDGPRWSVPWGTDTVLQVMVLWFVTFFGLGQVVLPLVVRALGLLPQVRTPWGQGLYIFTSYGLVSLVGVAIVWLHVRRYRPLDRCWFDWRLRRRTLVWALGGYLVAQPLVFVATVTNQKLLGGRGGGNPLIPILATTQDPWLLALFALVIVGLAPFFEEVVFRGFLLPSLTRQLPVAGAICVSGGIFALAHLSVGEFLPLAVLGILLGFVYTREGGLWTPILLHALWNGGSFVSLLILGHGG
ncbi:MAG: CPBP family intramembrane metalloprotease [Gloeomargarita sp. SKYG116]|nr:CPBP family intramembrane metalloprotease [Gloeomargarita sp. SKYG116]MDW8400500.1 type II CAAX endopeptidase family protein [Gloeomargarita sp. SKYGB_i_bin116]